MSKELHTIRTCQISSESTIVDYFAQQLDTDDTIKAATDTASKMAANAYGHF